VRAKLGSDYYDYVTNQRANVLTVIDLNGDNDGSAAAVVGTLLLAHRSRGSTADGWSWSLSFAKNTSAPASSETDWSSAEKNLRALIASTRNGSVGRARWRIRAGVPSHEIVEMAKEADIDLIVIATHGTTQNVVGLSQEMQSTEKSEHLFKDHRKDLDLAEI